MEALKNRVAAFTESILTMACPVLLAVALNKVSLNNVRSKPIGDAIYFAVTNLSIALCTFIVLLIANMLKQCLHHESLLKYLYLSSKLLVHVSAILQSVLAYMILRIKLDLQQSNGMLFVCILFSFFPVYWCIQSARIGQKQDKDSYKGFHDKLGQSLDVLASGTSFLFQMLVALAFESPASNGQDNNGPIVFTFVFCLIANNFMLSCTVLGPIQFSSDGDDERQRKCDMLCMVSHAFCLALTMILTIVVPMLMKLTVDIEWAIGMVMVPWISIGAIFLLVLCKTGPGAKLGEDEAKPAPLGITKAMFAGFLALLIPSFSSGTVSGSTKAFIVISAGVVISGLLWRLLTHLAPMRAAIVTADAACLVTLLMVMTAGIYFVLVAKDAFAQGNITCQSPCNTGQQIQDSILTCFRNNITEFQGKNWTAVLSCVPC